MTDRCECGLLTLYRELAAEYASLDQTCDELIDEADAVREMCERALREAGIVDMPTSLPGLVRAVIDAITGGREP